MDERYGLCIGIPQKFVELMAPTLADADLKVSFWPSLRSYEASVSEGWRSLTRDRVHLAVLDHSYKPRSLELEPHPGYPATLEDRLKQLRAVFPVAALGLVTDRPVTCTRELYEEFPSELVGHTSYGFLWNGGVEGVIATFKRFL